MKFDVPNLDGLPDGELAGLHVVLENLTAYAARTLRAREHRLAGHIELALSYEALADQSYKRLPKWARW